MPTHSQFRLPYRTANEKPSNARRCWAFVLPYSRGGTRTPDPVINSHLLYHLSYSGKMAES